ncbi:MAG: aminotransferase class I/II-fold pyridoxal phosphate-dependent enzyme, partial [Euryarchaeota archaeon]|nr:aminotransferase class I/II-fold pyridoxal phosphate-dependent enzyme [Euryarchaeota archaeon]
LVADPSSFHVDRDPRLELFRAFCRYWNSVGVNLAHDELSAEDIDRRSRRLDSITPVPRQAFLLMSVEDFSLEETAYILGKGEEETSQLIEQAGREIAQQMATEVLIIEDDPYGKLRYTGDDIPTLYSMDTEGRVIYLGTFSKILVPGFRLAWTVAPEPILRRIVISKQATDLCTNSFNQFIAADMMANDIVERHLPNIIELYRGKRDIFLKAMEETFPREHVRWTRSEGGLFTWAELPRHVNTKEMLKEAVEKKVAYVPGEAFYVNRADGSHTMRLNFSHASDEDLDAGVRRLAEVIVERIEKPTARVA